MGSCWQGEVRECLRSLKCPQGSCSVKFSSLFTSAAMKPQADTPLNTVCARATLPQGSATLQPPPSLPELSSLTSLCLNCHPTQHLSSLKPHLKDVPFWETFAESRLSWSVLLPLVSKLPPSIPVCLAQMGLQPFAQKPLSIAMCDPQGQDLGPGLLSLPSAPHRAGGVVDMVKVC